VRLASAHLFVWRPRSSRVDALDCHGSPVGSIRFYGWIFRIQEATETRVSAYVQPLTVLGWNTSGAIAYITSGIHALLLLQATQHRQAHHLPGTTGHLYGSGPWDAHAQLWVHLSALFEEDYRVSLLSTFVKVPKTRCKSAQNIIEHPWSLVSF
jgi:hypothetical protein